MNRQEFMKRLEELLQDISENEREEALQYYNDYFDDAGAENEAQIIEELGSPEQVARTIKAGMSDADGEYTETGYADSRFQEHQNLTPKDTAAGEPSGKQRKQPNFWKILSIILLCILLLPVIIPLGCIALGLILLVVFGIAGMAVGAVALCIAFLITGVVLIGYGIWRIFFTPALGLCLSGVGCLLLAVGILVTLLVVAVGIKLVPWLIRAIVELISFPLRKAGVIA